MGLVCVASSDIPPRRNLPNAAEPWGRFIEKERAEIWRKLEASDLARGNLNKSFNGALGVVQNQISNLADVTNDMSTVLAESAVSQEEIAQIQDDLAENATVLTTLQSDLSTARSTLDAHESTMASLQTDLSTAKSTLDGVQNDLAANATVLTTLQSDLSTAKSTLGAHESTMTSLQTDLSTAKGTLTSLQSDLGSARSDLATVQTDLAQAKSDIAAAKSSMNDLTTTVSSVDGKATTSGKAPTTGDASGKPEGAMWYVMDASGNLTGTYILKSGTWVEYAWGSSSIADAAITNAKIANLDAGKITSGYVDAARIAANSITADKLLVGGGGDYSPNPTFDPAGPLLGTPHSWIPGNGGHSVQLTARDNVFPDSTAFPVAKGDTFYITCEAAHLSGTAPLSLGLWWTVRPINATSNATSIQPYDNLTLATDLGWSANNSDWHTYAATISVPTAASDAVVTAARGYIHMLVDLPGQETSAQNTWLIGNYHIYKVSDGTLIADGSISTNKLVANAVTADKLAANSVTAEKIVAGAISTDKLAANAVTAEKITTGAVGADKIAGNSVHADHLVAGAVTTEKIVAGAVGADKIAGNSIHADHLVANSVTADKLAANAVTAEKIVAGAVGADKIAGNSIHADHLVANSVTAEKIVSEAIGTDKLAANSVNAEKIVSDAITADKLAANSVTGVKIRSRAITTDKLAAGAVTTAKLSATAIDGMTITGATIQTSTNATTSGGVLMNSGGIFAYNNNGDVTVAINASDGSMWAGSMYATGTFQSASSGGRAVLTGDGISFYTPSGDYNGSIRAYNPGNGLFSVRITAPSFGITTAGEPDNYDAVRYDWMKSFLSDNYTTRNLFWSAIATSNEYNQLRSPDGSAAIRASSSGISTVSSSLTVSGGALNANGGMNCNGNLHANGNLYNANAYTNGPSGSYRAVYVRSDGLFLQTTSSRRYKQNIQYPGDITSPLLDVNIAKFVYNADVENGVATERVGLIAEDVDEAGVTWLVDYDDQGRPDAIRYELVGVAALQLIQKQAARIDALETRVAVLEGGTSGH